METNTRFKEMFSNKPKSDNVSTVAFFLTTRPTPGLETHVTE